MNSATGRRLGAMDNTPTNDPSAPAALGLLADKVAFVSGAGRGIGAAAARLFAREGADVMLVARTESQLAAVTEDITSAGGSARYTVCDLGAGDSIRAAVDATVAAFGKLDV